MKVPELRSLLEQIQGMLDMLELPDGSYRADMTKVYIAMELAKRELEAAVAECSTA